jgi:hypothetical protein
MEDDYKVGYGKPPPNWQYKKGDRANPNGRRGKSGETGFAAGDALARLRSKKIKVPIDGGKTKLIWQEEYTVASLVRRALNGDLRATRVLIDMHAQSESEGDFVCEPVYVTPKEAKLRRLRKG